MFTIDRSKAAVLVFSVLEDCDCTSFFMFLPVCCLIAVFDYVLPSNGITCFGRDGAGRCLFFRL